jgi:hypothetical protein
MDMNKKYLKYVEHVNELSGKLLKSKNSKIAESEKIYDVASLYPEYPTIEKIDFPIENVKEIVEQIILLNREINNGHYSEDITITIEILNDSLKRLLNPSIIISG